MGSSCSGNIESRPRHWQRVDLAVPAARAGLSVAAAAAMKQRPLYSASTGSEPGHFTAGCGRRARPGLPRARPRAGRRTARWRGFMLLLRRVFILAAEVHRKAVVICAQVAGRSRRRRGPRRLALRQRLHVMRRGRSAGRLQAVWHRGRHPASNSGRVSRGKRAGLAGRHCPIRHRPLAGEEAGALLPFGLPAGLAHRATRGICLQIGGLRCLKLLHTAGCALLPVFQHGGTAHVPYCC
jgi:hypothetical protein